jgi:hypothetical protein
LVLDGRAFAHILPGYNSRVVVVFDFAAMVFACVVCYALFDRRMEMPVLREARGQDLDAVCRSTAALGSAGYCFELVEL